MFMTPREGNIYLALTVNHFTMSLEKKLMVAQARGVSLGQ